MNQIRLDFASFATKYEFNPTFSPLLLQLVEVGLRARQMQMIE